MTADIVNPTVNDRAYQHFERVQGPTKVERTVRAALNGDPLPQMLLFNAMVDTWPDLGQALNQVTDEVTKAPLNIEPFAEEGEEPSQQAQDKARLIKRLAKSMRPDLRTRRDGWQGTLKGLGMGYYYGIAVREVHWEQSDVLIPISTTELDPIYYRYPSMGGDEDRLMFSPKGRLGGMNNLEDFDPDHFLVGENRWHRGGTLTTAPLRALIGYWLAANYGLKWLMQYSQIYGVPFRIGTYPEGDTCAKNALNGALANLGAAGYAAAPAGTKIETIPLPASAAALPQKELIEMANNAVAKFILGQTLTSDVGSSGSRALGDVHEKVRRDRIESCVCFVSALINSQLIPAVVRANWADETELPHMQAEWPDDEDGLTKVERDEKLFSGSMRLPVAKRYVYERHGIPEPEDGEELFLPTTPPTNPPQAPKVLGDEPGQAGGKGFPPQQQVEPGQAPPKQAQAQRADLVTAAATLNTATLDALQANVAKLVPNVAEEWLEPARDLFAGLVNRALSGEVDDAEFGRVLAEAAATVDDLELNTDALETALVNAVGTAMLAGAGQKALDLPAL